MSTPLEPGSDFVRQRNAVCEEYALQEDQLQPGQLMPWEYFVAVVAILLSFIGILLAR